MKMVLENSAGKKDYVLSMTLYSFAIIMIKFILAGISFSYSTFSIVVTNPDAGFVTTVFGTLLAAYVARRYTDRNFEHKDYAAELAVPPATSNGVDGPDLPNL